MHCLTILGRFFSAPLTLINIHAQVGAALCITVVWTYDLRDKHVRSFSFVFDAVLGCHRGVGQYSHQAHIENIYVRGLSALGSESGCEDRSAPVL